MDLLILLLLIPSQVLLPEQCGHLSVTRTIYFLHICHK